MPAPVILSDVFRSLRGELGEEDTGVTFEDGPPPLDRIDVMIYRPARPDGTTLFATIGMSAHPMPGGEGRPGGGRAELRLHRRGLLGQREEGEIAMRLANLATYPWTNGRALGWGEVVAFHDDVPTFPGCSRAFLAGPWVQNQPSFLETREEPVRVLNAVPISEPERAAAVTTRPETFFGDLLDARDVLAPPAF